MLTSVHVAFHQGLGQRSILRIIGVSLAEAIDKVPLHTPAKMRCQNHKRKTSVTNDSHAYCIQSGLHSTESICPPWSKEYRIPHTRLPSVSSGYAWGAMQDREIRYHDESHGSCGHLCMNRTAHQKSYSEAASACSSRVRVHTVPTVWSQSLTDSNA
jgi:hypothetical protein